MRQVEARGVTLAFSHTNPFAQLAFQKISVPDNPPIEVPSQISVKLVNGG